MNENENVGVESAESTEASTEVTTPVEESTEGEAPVETTEAAADADVAAE